MKMNVGVLCVLLGCLLFASCKNSNQSNFNKGNSNSNQSNAQASPGNVEVKKMEIKSSAFQEGGMIPKQYTCDGQNISPPLEWSDVSPGAKSLALIADDPDAPSGTFTHWVIFNMPATAKGLPENLAQQGTIEGGGRQGKNDFKKSGYGGPCPPSGTHRYFFKLYALDRDLSLDDNATKSDVEKAMQGHVLAQGQLMGRYQR